MKPLLIGLVMLVPTPSLYAAQLAVKVTGLEAQGEIHLAIYDDPRVFEGDRGDQGGPQPGIIAGTIQPAGPESFTSTFELPTGVYAVGIFHDLNGDGAWSKFSRHSKGSPSALATMCAHALPREATHNGVDSVCVWAKVRKATRPVTQGFR